MNEPRFEDICRFSNLLAAAKKAIKGRWRYSREHALFRLDMERELLQIKHELVKRSYRPLAYRTFEVNDPKRRVISSAPVRDRVVHHALINVIGPRLENSFIAHSYACRKGKGTHLAIEHAQRCARRYRYYAHFDVVRFFDSVDHAELKTMLAKKIVDSSILWLLEKIIDHPASGMAPGKSLPIGNLTSQYFGNIYLDALDHIVKDGLGVKGFLRYMDDFLIFCDDKARLKELSLEVREFVREKLALRLTSSGVNPVYSGVTFLGLRIFPYRRRLQQARWRRFKKKFRQIQKEYEENVVSKEHFLSSVMSMAGNLTNADTQRLRGEFFDRYAIEL